MLFSSWEPRLLQRSPTSRPLLSRCMISGSRSLFNVPLAEGEIASAENAEGMLTDARDRMQADMRFSRTSAAITPQVFTDVLQAREAHEYERVSTVRVEQTEPEIAATSSTPSSAPKAFVPSSSKLSRSLHDGQLDGGVGGDRRGVKIFRSVFCARPSKKWAVVPHPARVP